MLLTQAFLFGCFAQVEIETDPDGDGVPDSVEAELGTDPSKSDSDGDDYDDGEEVAQNTDPADESDHPYLNGWRIDSCRYDIEPTGGWEVDDVFADLSFTDQYGEEVRLHDFCDQVVLLVDAGFT